MRQQRNNGILYRRSERAAVRPSMRESLLAIRHQKLVKVRVSTSDRHVLDPLDESQLVCSCPKNYVAAKVCSQFGTALIAAAMRDSHPARRQAQAGQLPAQTDQRGHKELNLMPIRMPGNTDILEHHPNISFLETLERQALVDD